VSAPGSPDHAGGGIRDAFASPPAVSGLRWPDEAPATPSDEAPVTPSSGLRLAPERETMSPEQQQRVDARHADATARFLNRTHVARQQRSPTVHPNAPVATASSNDEVDSPTPSVTSPKDAARQSRALLADQVAALRQAKQRLAAALDEEKQKLRDELEHVEELEEELERIRTAARARESQYAGTTWTMAEEMTSLRAQLAAANRQRSDSESTWSTVEFEKAELEAKNQELEIQTQRWRLQATRATFRGVIRLDALALQNAFEGWVEWSRFRHTQRLLMQTTQRELQSGKARIEALETENAQLRERYQGQERVLEQEQERHATNQVLSTERHRASVERKAEQILRHMRHRQAANVLVSWQAYASFTRRAMAVTGRAVARMRQGAVASALEAWGCWAAGSARRRRLVSKALLRTKHRQLAQSLLGWRTYVVSSVRSRAVVAHAVVRIRHGVVSAALEAWRAHVVHDRRNQLVVARLLSRMQAVCVASALDAWADWAGERVHHRVAIATHVRHWRRDSSDILSRMIDGWRRLAASRRHFSRVAARCIVVLAHGHTVRVWRSWSALAQRGVRSRLLMQRLVHVIRNSVLLSAWRTWRIDVATQQHERSLSVTVERAVTRKQHKAAALVLRSWRTYVAFVRRSMALTQRALARMKQAAVLTCLEAWALWVSERLHCKSVVKQALMRHDDAAAAAGFLTWRRWTGQRLGLRQRASRCIAHLASLQKGRVWEAWSGTSKQRARLRSQQQRLRIILAGSTLSSVWQRWRAYLAAVAQTRRLITRVIRRQLSRVVATSFVSWCEFVSESLEQMLQQDEEQLRDKRLSGLEEQLAASEASATELHQQLDAQKQTLASCENQLETLRANESKLHARLAEQAAATDEEVMDVRKQLAATRLQLESVPTEDQLKSTTEQLEKQLSASKREVSTVRDELFSARNESAQVTEACTRLSALYAAEIEATVAACTEELVCNAVSCIETEQSADKGAPEHRGKALVQVDRGEVAPDQVARNDRELCLQTLGMIDAGAVSAQQPLTRSEKIEPQKIIQAPTPLLQPPKTNAKTPSSTIAMQDSGGDSSAELAQIRAQLLGQRSQISQVSTQYQRGWVASAQQPSGSTCMLNAGATDSARRLQQPQQRAEQQPKTQEAANVRDVRGLVSSLHEEVKLSQWHAHARGLHAQMDVLKLKRQTKPTAGATAAAAPAAPASRPQERQMHAPSGCRSRSHVEELEQLKQMRVNRLSQRSVRS
jgi:hypothetical protein